MADILAVLYGRALRIDPSNPAAADRDRFILSKGHACSALYAVLAETGFFAKNLLEQYSGNGSPLAGHVTTGLPGIEFSSGSLGHGLPVACGMALAAKRDNKKHGIFVVLGDGECDEGANWEAFLFAPQHKLDNMVVIIDRNKIQSLGTTREVLNLEPLTDKLKAFNWSVKTIDGHSIKDLCSVLGNLPFEKEKPSCLIADTVKGRGVSFMENKLLWHYKTPTIDELKAAISELEASK